MQPKMIIDYDQPLSRVARHHVDTLSSGLYLLLLQLNDEDDEDGGGCGGGSDVLSIIISSGPGNCGPYENVQEGLCPPKVLPRRRLSPRCRRSSPSCQESPVQISVATVPPPVCSVLWMCSGQKHHHHHHHHQDVWHIMAFIAKYYVPLPSLPRQD